MYDAKMDALLVFIGVLYVQGAVAWGDGYCVYYIRVNEIRIEI